MKYKNLIKNIIIHQFKNYLLVPIKKKKKILKSINFKFKKNNFKISELFYIQQ